MFSTSKLKYAIKLNQLWHQNDCKQSMITHQFKVSRIGLWQRNAVGCEIVSNRTKTAKCCLIYCFRAN